jgi:hypothetical protein
LNNFKEGIAMANERLQELQAALQERGVRDVKFFFQPGLDAVPASVVASGVANFLDAYVRGRMTSVDRVGDMPIN